MNRDVENLVIKLRRRITEQNNTIEAAGNKLREQNARILELETRIQALEAELTERPVTYYIADVLPGPEVITYVPEAPQISVSADGITIPPVLPGVMPEIFVGDVLTEPSVVTTQYPPEVTWTDIPVTTARTTSETQPEVIPEPQRKLGVKKKKPKQPPVVSLEAT